MGSRKKIASNIPLEKRRTWTKKESANFRGKERPSGGKARTFPLSRRNTGKDQTPGALFLQGKGKCWRGEDLLASYGRAGERPAHAFAKPVPRKKRNRLSQARFQKKGGSITFLGRKTGRRSLQSSENQPNDREAQDLVVRRPAGTKRKKEELPSLVREKGKSLQKKGEKQSILVKRTKTKVDRSCGEKGIRKKEEERDPARSRRKGGDSESPTIR